MDEACHEASRCELCGRRLDRPSFYPDCLPLHPPATPAEELVNAIERAINNRKGIGWDCCDEEIQDGIRQELVDLVRSHAERAQAIVEAPRIAMFADGREPTTNERHLLNLLSWREKEAAEAKAEKERLAALADSLAVALAPFADLASWRGPVGNGGAWTWIGCQPNPVAFAIRALQSTRDRAARA